MIVFDALFETSYDVCRFAIHQSDVLLVLPDRIMGSNSAYIVLDRKFSHCIPMDKDGVVRVIGSFDEVIRKIKKAILWGGAGK